MFGYGLRMMYDRDAVCLLFIVPQVFKCLDMMIMSQNDPFQILIVANFVVSISNVPTLFSIIRFVLNMECEDSV